MNTEFNPKLYEECERAFLTAIAQVIEITVSRAPELSKEEKERLIENLTFAVAAQLSSSAFNGRVAGEEIYPKLGFYHGESSDTLVVGESSRIHGMVPEVMDVILSRI